MSSKRKTRATVADLSPLPIVGYARVSRVGGRKGDGYISIPEQHRTLRGLVAARGRTLYPTILQDEDRSGGSLDREQFQKALDLVREGKAGGIAVQTLDRFSRNEMDFWATLGEIEKLGGVLLCGDGDVTLQGGQETFVATMRIAVAALPRRQTAEYAAKAVRSAVADRGIHLQAPYGYAKGEGKKLVEHPEEAPIVRRIFNLRLEGLGWGAIAKTLNNLGSRPRPYVRGWRDPETGERFQEASQTVWSHRYVARIVSNKAYYGLAFNGDHETEDAHPALVSRAVWERANSRKGTRHEGPGEGHLLTGLCRCAECGYALAYSRKPDGYRYLRCQRKNSGDGRCSGLTVPADALEAYVEERFAERWLDGDRTYVPVSGALTVYAEKVSEAKATFDRATAKYLRLDLDGEADRLAASQVKTLAEELRAREREYAEAKRAEQRVDLPITLDREVYSGAPLPDKRHWLGIVFPLIVVRRGDEGRRSMEQRVRLLGSDAITTADSSSLIAAATQVSW